jgi:pheromone shutdown protein TraB
LEEAFQISAGLALFVSLLVLVNAVVNADAILVTIALWLLFTAFLRLGISLYDLSHPSVHGSVDSAPIFVQLSFKFGYLRGGEIPLQDQIDVL